MAKKYTLLPISLKQGFANGGIKQRVPYQLPAADDDLNWLEGFTDAYQRPVITENLGEKGGRYVRMGQINQILENVSQAILNIKQSLNNVSETIDKGILTEIDKVVTNANNVLANRKVLWLQTLNNQNCAGLKNFTAVKINNFKNTPTAVANLEWCNGLPIQSVANFSQITGGYTVTIRQKNIFYTVLISRNGFGDKGMWQTYINGLIFGTADSYGEEGSGNKYSPVMSQYLRNKDVLRFEYRPLSEKYDSMASYLGS